MDSFVIGVVSVSNKHTQLGSAASLYELIYIYSIQLQYKTESDYYGKILTKE